MLADFYFAKRPMSRNIENRLNIMNDHYKTSETSVNNENSRKFMIFLQGAYDSCLSSP